MKNVNQYVMKDSGVQWIGQVPKHWIGYRMQYITRLEKGKMPQELTSTGGDAPYLTMDLLRNRETVVTYPVNTKGLVCVEDNDLLLLWDGANAGEILQAKRGYLGSTMAIIHYSKEIIESKFAFYFFKALERRFKEDANGTTIPHFNRASLNSCKYFLPPTLSEQRAIADWLDAKCADIDAAIELQQRMIDKLKAYKTAVIHQAVTKGLDKNLKPTDLKDSGIKWLGMIPKHWDILRAKNIFVRKSRLVREEDETITCFRDGQVTLRKNRRSDGFTEAVKEIGYQGVRIGDLVIHQMDAFAGAIGVSDSDGKSSPVYICLRPKIENCINQYYAYLLREMARAGFIRALYRGIRERSTDFRFETFANVSLPVPTLEEQRDIIDYIDAKCADIDVTIALKEQKQEKLKAYKKTIIFEYVTGKKQVANINK
ncbi:MAG: restriction endonuclease subunit S [Prevotella nanceiensis]|uniref:restriction endonuclease subunit S n=1 Tax=Hoylesella nanceiensis TaxID=425941 RepID=UPI001CB0A337|nr:restriction endonuclease subunit S [Hoylesella nanceiensis]MBF1437138.1 restriction endonuclease subunit S [Hoylesella nanceiensis]